MGGMIAQHVALLIPERINSLGSLPLNWPKSIAKYRRSFGLHYTG